MQEWVREVVESLSLETKKQWMRQTFVRNGSDEQPGLRAGRCNSWHPWIMAINLHKGSQTFADKLGVYTKDHLMLCSFKMS